jgi:hypothetical protein
MLWSGSRRWLSVWSLLALVAPVLMLGTAVALAALSGLASPAFGWPVIIFAVFATVGVVIGRPVGDTVASILLAAGTSVLALYALRHDGAPRLLVAAIELAGAVILAASILLASAIARFRVSRRRTRARVSELVA